MKKLTLLLFLTVLSTTTFFAQNKEADSNEEMQAMPELVTETYPVENNATISEYANEEDLATQQLLEENAKKSKIAKAKREQQTEAVRKRLQKSEKAKANAKAKKAQQESYKNLKLDEAGNPINN